MHKKDEMANHEYCIDPESIIDFQNLNMQKVCAEYVHVVKRSNLLYFFLLAIFNFGFSWYYWLEFFEYPFEFWAKVHIYNRGAHF